MKQGVFILILAFFSLFAAGCSASATVSDAANAGANAQGVNSADTSVTSSAPKGATIEIDPNGPADTVKTFYAKLREGKVREAIHLTNLRPAIEGLTDNELKEFAVDFEAIAKLIPAEIEINGEIISADKATVTARLPNPEKDKLELQELQLKKAGDHWIILSADEETEKKIKAEGSNYFRSLKIETHQEEAKKMLERISKAQLAYSVQNDASYADLQKLILEGLLPEDVLSSESTGYVYAVVLSPDQKNYSATATPAVYGKTGKMSYLLKPAGVMSQVTSADTKGKPMK